MNIEVALDAVTIIENVTLQYDINTRKWYARCIDNVKNVRGDVILAKGNGYTIEVALLNLGDDWKLEYERKKL